jgi:hypothetical protein
VAGSRVTNVDLRSLGGTLDVALVERLRAVVGGAPTTESEFRALSELADGLARALHGQITGSERRLQRLNRSAAPPLAGIGRELQRLETLRPQLTEVRALLADLEQRGRELRASWLISSV